MEHCGRSGENEKISIRLLEMEHGEGREFSLAGEQVI
jgi:hypothetical protein